MIAVWHNRSPHSSMERDGDRQDQRQGESMWALWIQLTLKNEQALFVDLCFFQTQDGRIKLLVAENWYCLSEIVIFIHKVITVYKGILHKCHLDKSSQ